MLKIHFRNALRNLVRFRSFSIINLVGLTLGLSAIMVMAVMLYAYQTTNSQFANKDRMYYLKMRNPDGSTFMQSPYPFLYAALASCPDIEAGTHIQGWNEPWLKAGTKEFQDWTSFVDSDFLRVFSFPLETGNAATALRDKYSVVLSHEMAEKLFGSAAAAQGSRVQIDDTLAGTVTAVLKPVPSNTSVRPRVLLTAALLNDAPGFKEGANWYNTFSENYLLLRPGADTAKINAQLAKIVQLKFDPANRGRVPFLLPYARFRQAETVEIEKVLVKGLEGTIVFLLLVMVANLLNLNTATMLSRQKDMAVRKILGSSRLHIVLQFVLENAMLVFGALLLGFWLFQVLLLPAINGVIGRNFGTIVFNIRRDYPLAGIFAAGGLIIVALAGSIPGFHFGSLRPVDAIKGHIIGRREGNYVRNGFIVLQFAVATIIIGVAIVLRSQIGHMKSAALGFDKDHVMMIPLDLAYRNPAAAGARYDALLNELRADPGVGSFSSSWDIPTRYQENYNGFVDPVTQKEVNMRKGVVDDGMLPTYRIRLLEGVNFDGVRDSSNFGKVIINRKAAEKFGWKHAVGHVLREKGGNEAVTVIGVMEDFHYSDLSRDIQPLVHSFGGHQQLGYREMSVRVVPGHEAEVLARVQQGFREMPSRRAFSYEWLSDKVDQQYSNLEGLLGATNFVAILTVLIAAMGLFGLIAAFTQRRVKEVGIRKVLGAGVRDIVLLLSRSYLLLIALALVVAAPVVWYVMHSWLQDFAYRVSIEWWMLVGAGAIALAIGVVTIGWHVVRAARANPVESLRSE
ncbi:MAG TPA: ABC transporter permease [Puia sp.]|jgi:putative ABC transport system permease protein|nr:ABC transporter permease [Puia sp.]